MPTRRTPTHAPRTVRTMRRTPISLDCERQRRRGRETAIARWYDMAGASAGDREHSPWWYAAVQVGGFLTGDVAESMLADADATLCEGVQVGRVIEACHDSRAAIEAALEALQAVLGDIAKLEDAYRSGAPLPPLPDSMAYWPLREEDA
jgi:hypothetical protein